MRWPKLYLQIQAIYPIPGYYKLPRIGGWQLISGIETLASGGLPVRGSKGGQSQFGAHVYDRVMGINERCDFGRRGTLRHQEAHAAQPN